MMYRCQVNFFFKFEYFGFELNWPRFHMLYNVRIWNTGYGRLWDEYRNLYF